ncbi:hypothetical protein SAMN05444410_1047 [Hydrobacter penzbergensis]|uniref:Chaperone of endosialidase n=1 Tax=Hydrobacter penzbergensis TaxID=1235997 RepID=A0A8X8IAU9_9BACT|nr:hypothetical protein [Hydrobacter penzbergensis]SDW58009.1 hypothetical protein SAMN05444410_1047 [Hydrobacter penzbergensis]
MQYSIMKFLLITLFISICIGTKAQYLSTSGGTVSGQLTLTGPGNALQITGQTGSNAYMSFDQTVNNTGGKKWRVGHTGYVTGFSTFDILNGSDNILALSIASNGNAGFGSINPNGSIEIFRSNGEASMHLNAGNGSPALRFQKAGSNTFGIIGNYPNGNDLNFYNYTTNNSQMYFKSDGKIGVGTTSPSYTIDINGTVNTTVSSGSNLFLTKSSGASIAFFDGVNYNALIEAGLAGHRLEFWTNDGNSLVERMRINQSGNVGIGTTNPSEKLSVNGNIRTQKLIVTQTGWSDYVFDKDYKLRSLRSLETFIKENKHLPEIPAANEVETKGINVGDNQALLLKKIEELTLYVIEQNKKIEQLERKIEKQQRK